MSEEEYILDWIDKVSENKEELGGFSICPYARSAVYKVITCEVEEISPESLTDYDVVIYVIDEEMTVKEIKTWVKFYNLMYSDWCFFCDSKNELTELNGVRTNNERYNLIITQPKKKLEQVREQLKKTSYYSYWPVNYYNEIVGD